jgi:hypothetical protein
MAATLSSSRAIWIPVAIATALNGLLFCAIAWRNSPLLHDATTWTNPDARHYFILGLNIFERGRYSRQEHEPFQTDALRTPLFPVLVGLAWKVGGVPAVHLVSVVSHIAACALLYKLVEQLFGGGAAVAASCLLATDLMLVSSNFTGMAESAFLPPLIAASIFFCRALRADPTAQIDWRRIAAGGLLLGVATLIRPTSLYAGPIVAAAFFCRYVFAGWRSRGAAVAAVALVASLALPGMWMGRNWAVFGMPKITTVDSANFVYFVGAGAYQVHEGITLEEAHRRIQQQFDLPSYGQTQNPWIGDLTPLEIDRKLRAATPHVLKMYPASLVISSCQGVGKALISHSAVLNAEQLAMAWHAPTIAGLARFDVEAFSRLADNSPVLVGSLLWQLAHSGVMFLAAAVGLWQAAKPRRMSFAVGLLVAILAYFTATIAMFGADAFYRCRIPAIPFLDAFAGLGLAHGLAAIGVRSRQPKACDDQSHRA